MWAVKHYTHCHNLYKTDGSIQFKLTAWANKLISQVLVLLHTSSFTMQALFSLAISHSCLRPLFSCYSATFILVHI